MNVRSNQIEIFSKNHFKKLNQKSLLFDFRIHNRIIPFVAADAVMGVPNLEEDERLNLGGVIEQRTPSQPTGTVDEFAKTG